MFLIIMDQASLAVFLTIVMVLSCIQHSFSQLPHALRRQPLGMDTSTYTSTDSLSVQNISTECLSALEQMRNSSAKFMKILDSYGKADAGFLEGNWNWLGHYQECLNITDYNYCLSLLQLNLKNTSVTMLPGAAIKWGVCVPHVCSDSDVLNGLIDILDMVELPFNVSEVNATSVTCVKDPPIPYNAGFIIFVVISSILALLMLSGTTLDIILIFVSRQQTPYVMLDNNAQVDMAVNSEILNQGTVPGGTDVSNKDGGDGKIQADGSSQHSPHEGSIQADVASTQEAHATTNQGKQKEGLFQRFLLSFAVSRNLAKLFDRKISDSSIACLHGIRVLSISWVILGHTFAAMSLYGTTQNILKGLVWLPRFGFQAVSNAFPAVDTFFFLSGLLVAYTALGRMKKTEGKLPWHWFYIHRYLRLTPALGMTILIQLYLRPFLGEGPLWQSGAKDPHCEKYWWPDLLYINNFYPPDANACIDWVWYLANDTQFYVISPLILIPLFWMPILGVIIILSLCVVSAVVTAVLMVHYNFSALFLVAIVQGPATGPDFNDVVYAKPYCRIQPYLVGMLLGYALYRWGRKYKLVLHPAVVAAGWAISSGVGVAVVYGFFDDFHSHELTTAASAMYMALSRFAWACCLAWVVIACKYGYGGWVNDFLSWSAWVPLSRLTYSTYLIHMIIITIFGTNMASPIYMSIILFSVYYAGIVAMSYGAATVLALAVEYPFANMEKLLLPGI